MKIILSRVQFELTRRCNQECLHCCRGEAEDMDLTKEIVDALFDNNEICSIGDLLFSGGEPTLNGEMLEYIVDKIIGANIPVRHFIFGINGLSYSQALINGLNKLRDYIIYKSEEHVYCPGLLLVSQDQFHKKANPEVIDKIKNLSYCSPIFNTTMAEDDILPYGRAITNNLTTQKPDLSSLIDYQKNYKIKEDEGEEYLIIDYQYISSNGNVINDGCQSYESMDEYALGNVTHQKIDEIYLKPRPQILSLQNNN